MSLKYILAPSILSCDYMKIGQECEELLKGGADWLHLDIMDGNFVENISFGPQLVKQLRNKYKESFLDCHLMVKEPQKWVNKFIESGASQISIHIESEYNDKKIGEILKEIKEKKVRSGIVVNPKSNLEQAMKLINDNLVDLVLIMTVEPGFGGQSFQEDQMGKVREIRNKYPLIDIQVDGGINIQNLDISLKAGANVIVSGTGIVAHSPYHQIINQFKQAFIQYIS